jgi:hypothetical protein
MHLNTSFVSLNFNQSKNAYGQECPGIALIAHDTGESFDTAELPDAAAKVLALVISGLDFRLWPYSIRRIVASAIHLCNLV